MFLDHQLAQQIVDRTMAIIGDNINVMNHAGTIIASGDNNRIGESHDGALLALKRGDTFEVSEGESHGLKGVKPGINLLLKNREEVIGVVGITGNPENIRTYAKLVKMTAEMIVEQAELVEQLQWDRRHREEFIHAWINGQLSKSDIQKWATRLDIDLSQPRVAVIIKFGKIKSQSKLRHVIELLEKPERGNLVAISSFDEITVLKPYHEGESGKAENRRIEQLTIRLEEADISNTHIALGRFFDDVDQIHLSYQSAAQVMSYGMRYYPQKQKFYYDDFRLPVLLSPLVGVWQGEQLSEPYLRLREKDSGGQLTHTLDTLFEHQGNMKACADALYIHRNTLRYRLDKIEQITGISLKSFSGLVELYLASQITQQ